MQTVFIWVGGFLGGSLSLRVMNLLRVVFLLSTCGLLSRHTLCGHTIFLGISDIFPLREGPRRSKSGGVVTTLRRSKFTIFAIVAVFPVRKGPLGNCVKEFWRFVAKIGKNLSGPVLRDTARLSQRYPPIARYGVFGVSTWPMGCDTPCPFSQRFPLGEHSRSGGAIPPLKRGISAILARYPMKTRQLGAIPPSVILSRKGIARYGGVSRTGLLRQKLAQNPQISKHQQNLLKSRLKSAKHSQRIF